MTGGGGPSSSGTRAHPDWVEGLSAAVSQCTSLEQAIELLLSRLGDRAGFEIGHAWKRTRHEREAFVSARVWRCPGDLGLGSFRTITDHLRLQAREDTWLSDTPPWLPAWFDDIAQMKGFIRLPLARECELRSSLIVSIPWLDRVECVLELYSRELKPKDPLLLEGIEELVSRIAFPLAALLSQRRLNETQSNLLTCLETLTDCFMVYSPVRDASGKLVDFRVEFVNEAVCKTRGIRKEQILGRLLSDFIPAPNRDLLMRDLTHVLETGETVTDDNRLYQETAAEGGAFRAYYVRVVRLGEAVATIWRDITNHWETEERFKKIYNEAPIGISILARGGLIIRANQAMANMLGYKPEELAGRYYKEFIHPDDPYWKQSIVLEQLFEGQLTRSVRERLCCRKDGEKVWLKSTATVIRGAQGDPLYAITMVEDTTESVLARKKILEQQQVLVQTSKITALGQMAAGISHEINNPLSVIYGTARVLEKKIAAGEVDPATLNDSIRKIGVTAKRIAKIIEGLRAFSRDGSQDPFEEARVRTVIDETLAFCAEKFRKRGIALAATVEPEQLDVLCRPVQLSEVLLNLLNNAYDAVSESGERTPWVHVSAQKEGQEIVFRVSNNGPSIAQESRDRIFEPFFTTKPVGQGTGLGLSIAKGIAENHGGSLSLESASPETCFALRLPAPRS